MARDKVVIIGLDGADLELIKPWIKEGELKTFKKIMDQGVCTEMSSITPPISGPAWASIYTGKNPGKHGVCDFFHLDKETYDIVPMTFSDITEETIWSILGRASKKNILLNMPITYPPGKVNGILVTGLHTPSEKGPFTYPDNFKHELNEILKDKYEIGAGPIDSKYNIDKYLERLNRVTDKQLFVALKLMDEKKWDFFMYVVQGTDQIQHALWHLIDEAHPKHDPNSKFKKAILQYYKKIDAFLAQVVERTEDKANLMIISDHGFKSAYKFMNLNYLLVKNGLIKFKKTLPIFLKRLLYSINATPLFGYNILMKLGLGQKRGQITKGRGHKLLEKLFLSFKDIDWTRTKACAVGNGGGIYINMSKKDRIEKEKEFLSVKKEILSVLNKAIDRKCSSKIEGISVREDIYSGKHIDNMPDIVVWPDKYNVFPLGAYEFPSNRFLNIVESPSGSHRDKAIFMAYGKDVKKTNLPCAITVFDIVPTILYLMGVEVKEDFDGRPLKDIFERPFSEKGTSVELTTNDLSKNKELTEEDAENLKSNLKDLGYI